MDVSKVNSRGRRMRFTSLFDVYFCLEFRIKSLFQIEKWQPCGRFQIKRSKVGKMQNLFSLNIKVKFTASSTFLFVNVASVKLRTLISVRILLHFVAWIRCNHLGFLVWKSSFFFSASLSGTSVCSRLVIRQYECYCFCCACHSFMWLRVFLNSIFFFLCFFLGASGQRLEQVASNRLFPAFRFLHRTAG